MKKSLLALAALTCVAGAAQAQSSVTLSGTVDNWFGRSQLSSTASGTANPSKLVVNSGGMTTSWFGMSGTEDLGAGLKAGFNVGGFFAADNGTMGRFATDALFTRDANAYLSGGFGTIKLGRSSAPAFLPTIIFNPYGDSFTFSPLVLHTYVGASKQSVTDSGWSNQVVYSTPNFGGFSANLHYQLGEQASNSANSNASNYGANAMYFNGGLGLTGYFEKAQVANYNFGGFGGASGSPLAYTATNWMLGGSYNFNVVKLFATYGQQKIDTAGSSTQGTLSGGLSIPAGGGTVLLAAAQSNKYGYTSGVKRTTASLGYDYNLSKRTDVYANYMYDKVTGNNYGNSVGVGIRHKF